MKYWARTRHIWGSLPCLAAIRMACLLFGNTPVPALSLLGSYGLTIPLALWLPLAICVYVSWGWVSGDARQEWVASRPIWLLDLVYGTSVVGLFCLACLWPPSHVDGGLGIATARNLVGYMGLCLIARGLLGSVVAPVLPAAYMLLCTIVGMGPDRRPYLWGWPLADGHTLWAWAPALTLMILGVVVIYMRAALGHLNELNLP